MRTLRKTSALPALVLALTASGLPAAEPSTVPREIAITFDDLPRGGPEIGLARTQALNAALLATLKERGIQSVGFVNEQKLYTLGEIDARTAILESWLEAGQELANHTFSHPSLQDTPLTAYQEDVLRGETVTRLLLARRGRTLRYFRHPYLRTGPTLEVRTAFETFLAGRGYTVAPVTIENSDYIYSLLYSRAKAAGDKATMASTAEAYLAFTEAQLDFWEGVAQTLLGRPMKQVLLLHANEINADHLGPFLDLLVRRGYRFIPLETALTDEAYRLPDTYAGRAGTSWLHRWSVSKGLKIDWTKEPEPSAEILERYAKARQSQ